MLSRRMNSGFRGVAVPGFFRCREFGTLETRIGRHSNYSWRSELSIGVRDALAASRCVGSDCGRFPVMSRVV
jgi:hypothetical protein